MPLKKVTTRPARSIFFISLGCPRNRVDTEVMIGLTTQSGFVPTDRLEQADVIIINTCGFLQSAREESIKTIQEVLEQKKARAKVVVTGCAVQNHRELLQKECPGVWAFVSPGALQGIVQAIQSGETRLHEAKSFLEEKTTPRVLSTPPHYAFLKIAEGCCKRCAFCAIPSIKGALRSKPVENICLETQKLVDNGVSEIILIAQDLGDWGKDLGYTGSEGLIHVLQRMQALSFDVSLRLLYLYPDEVSPALIDLIGSGKGIIPYLDMPIQHISNRMLKLMRRSTTRDKICSTVALLRKRIPGIVLRTSVIVGFPGETEADVRELEEFLESAPFEHVGFFSYSQEEGTPAAEFPGQVAAREKEERLQRLMAIQQKNMDIYLHNMVGRQITATIDGFHPETKLLMTAHYYGQCPEVDNCILINDPRGVTGFGKEYVVTISGVSGSDLVGKVGKGEK